MTFTASAKPIAGKLRQEVDVNGRHMIATDEPESLGGTDTAPAPHELLPAMVASCVSTMITLYAQRHGWAVDGLHVEVDYEPDTTPRHLGVRIHLPGNLDAEQAARLRRVAETCPVQRAFQAGFVFDEEVLLDVTPRVRRR